MRRSLHRLAVTLLTFVVVASACQSSDSSAPTSVATTSTTSTSDTTVAGFDDHTVTIIESVDAFDDLARIDGSQAAVKFAIPDLESSGVVWMDSNFYELHDEWYWFRLLNGHEVPNLPTAPVASGEGPTFSTIDEVYAWASTRPNDLPLDLRFTTDGGRLYSNRYYDLALRDADKSYGLGTLVRFDTETGERWVIETEFSEPTTPTTVAQFIDRLAETLPAEIGEQLEWVVRSPHQETTALEMVDTGARYHERIVRYGDLVAMGEVTVYNPGLAAGRLRLVESVDDLVLARSDDILVMSGLPDYLPPAAAILTSDPQTPLAHVNLLARNRGIPNVSIGGLLVDPAISIAARSRSYAVVQATADDVEITLITEADYRSWADRQTPDVLAVPAVDLESMPTVIPLTTLATEISTEADVEALRPVIGGKSAGFLALLGADEVSVPDSPLAITVAPYFRHLAAVETQLDAMLAHDDFQSDVRARFLLLEGPEDFADTYSTESDRAWAENFTAEHADDAIGEILDADGIMRLFRDIAMDDGDLDQIAAMLRSRFGELAVTQGFRFRSSSSVEDIEGFSGAGLYDSNTGFLDPDLQPDEDDHDRTVERAIKKTWASYWSFEAFEERRLENVDHRSGGMGVLVHPRFDDPLELDNGVATLTLLPVDGPDTARLEINVQAGDVSVTNPEAGSDILPEQISVILADGGDVSIERTAPSTLVAAGDVVMDDDAVVELLAQLDAVARLWRDRVNADLSPEQEIEILTLDFEFKHMAPGWPALADGSIRPDRLVIKQARSLDPGLRGVPEDVLALPVPRDLLARAILVEQVSCGSEATGIELTVGGLADATLAEAVAPIHVFSVTPDALDQEDCTRTTVLTSPEQMLIELLASGEGLEIG